jgi:hypothetical protein
VPSRRFAAPRLVAGWRTNEDFAAAATYPHAICVDIVNNLLVLISLDLFLGV